MNGRSGRRGSGGTPKVKGRSQNTLGSLLLGGAGGAGDNKTSRRRQSLNNSSDEDLKLRDAADRAEKMNTQDNYNGKGFNRQDSGSGGLNGSKNRSLLQR